MTGGYVALGVQAANADTFDGVFAAQRDYVYGLAHALLRNPQDAEDVTQDVFLRVYRALPQYRPERASMRTWLTRLVVNACNTHRRHNFLRGLLPVRGKAGEDPTLELADSSPWVAPEDQAVRSELRQTVRDVLARLRLEHRTVLVLHYYLDLSCPEIARILECPEGTVYSRLHYARQLVQEEMGKRTRE
jgi:RNA polymerase sigma-70 factor, ECF subfamily